MEKTLEERAKSYCYIERTDSIDCLHAYIIGATEQKAIDIDKACEWLCSHIDQDFVYATQGYRSLEGFIDSFRKTMMNN